MSTVDITGCDIINHVLGEEMGKRVEIIRTGPTADISLELSASELAEVTFYKSTLKVSSLKSLGQMRIVCKLVPGFFF